MKSLVVTLLAFSALSAKAAGTDKLVKFDCVLSNGVVISTQSVGDTGVKVLSVWGLVSRTFQAHLETVTDAGATVDLIDDKGEKRFLINLNASHDMNKDVRTYGLVSVPGKTPNVAPMPIANANCVINIQP